MRRLGPIQLVVVGLDRADDDIDRVGLHVHPRQVAGLIVIAQQRLRPKLEVAPEAGILGQGCGVSQLGRRPLHLRTKGHSIGHRSQASQPIPSNQGVETAQGSPATRRGARDRIKLRRGDVVGVEVGAEGHGSDLGHEGLVAVEPVPGAVVDLGEPPQGRSGHGGEDAVRRSGHLEPVDLIHLPRGVDQERQHATGRIGEPAQVGVEPDRGVGGEEVLGAAVGRASLIRTLGGTGGNEEKDQEGRAHEWLHESRIIPTMRTPVAARRGRRKGPLRNGRPRRERAAGALPTFGSGPGRAEWEAGEAGVRPSCGTTVLPSCDRGKADPLGFRALTPDPTPDPSPARREVGHSLSRTLPVSMVWCIHPKEPLINHRLHES